MRVCRPRVRAPQPKDVVPAVEPAPVGVGATDHPLQAPALAAGGAGCARPRPIGTW